MSTIAEFFLNIRSCFYDGSLPHCLLLIGPRVTFQLFEEEKYLRMPRRIFPSNSASRVPPSQSPSHQSSLSPMPLRLPTPLARCHGACLGGGSGADALLCGGVSIAGPRHGWPLALSAAAQTRLALRAATAGPTSRLGR